MDLHHLATFRMVTTLMSFSRAAVALDYAQSTVTAHIQALENDLNVRLFNRLGKQIELTDAGRRLQHYGERLLDLAEETHFAVTGSDNLTGMLTIGAPETIVTYRLPPIMRQFRDELPHVRLIFRPMPYRDLFRSVSDGEIDIAFLLERTIQSNTLHVEMLTREPLVIVAAPDHPLAAVSDLKLSALAGEALLLTERGCGYRGIFERELRAAGVLPVSNMEFDSVEAIKQCAIANVGIAVLPSIVVQHELRNGRLVALAWSAPDFEVATQMLWHKEKWISPVMNTFLSLCRDMG